MNAVFVKLQQNTAEISIVTIVSAEQNRKPSEAFLMLPIKRDAPKAGNSQRNFRFALFFGRSRRV
jgi:hypothetical protein